MFGCLATLLFSGRTSNSIGFLRTLQIGLGFIVLGLTLSVFAKNALWLSIGRFIIGIASGLISTSAMLGFGADTIPEQHKQNAPQFSSIITVIGFGSRSVHWWFDRTIFGTAPLVTPYIPVIFGGIGMFNRAVFN